MMRFYLSTISDVQAGEDGVSLRYENITAPLAEKDGLGLELAEFCITENLGEKKKTVMPHFIGNLNAVGHKVLHAPFNELLPHAIDPMVAEIARKRYTDVYRLCEEYRIPKMIVHCNYLSNLYFPVWFIDRQVEFWQRFLSENAAETQICLENVLEDDPGLLKEICRRVDDPRLALCLDIGHANLTPVEPMQWLEESLPYLSHMHIHNNKGLQPGLGQMSDTHSALQDGVIPMYDILSEVSGRKPETTITIETAHMERSIGWLKENRFL